MDAAQVGAERFNLFKGCPKAKTATMVLRGGSEQFIDEAERSLHDAIMIVRRAIKNASVVAGGGAIDMEISRYPQLERCLGTDGYGTQLAHAKVDAYLNVLPAPAQDVHK